MLRLQLILVWGKWLLLQQLPLSFLLFLLSLGLSFSLYLLLNIESWLVLRLWWGPGLGLYWRGTCRFNVDLLGGLMAVEIVCRALLLIELWMLPLNLTLVLLRRWGLWLLLLACRFRWKLRLILVSDHWLQVLILLFDLLNLLITLREELSWSLLLWVASALSSLPCHISPLRGNISRSVWPYFPGVFRWSGTWSVLLFNFIKGEVILLKLGLHIDELMPQQFINIRPLIGISLETTVQEVL